MPTRSTFIPQQKKYPKEPDQAYLSRLNRTKRAYQRVNFTYDPDRMELKRNFIGTKNVDFQREYSDCIVERLSSIQRVLLPQPNMFELENGELVSRDSAIVYKVMVKILDENAKKLGYNKVLELDHNIGQCLFTIGKYKRPQTEPTSFDRHGNITGMDINGYFWTYYTPDTKSTLDSIIKKYGKPSKPPTCCIANQQSSSPYSAVQTVINETDFYSGRPVQDIILGSRFNMPADPAKEWQKKKQELIKSGRATEAQLSKLTTDHIVKMLQEIEVQETKMR